MMKHIRMYRCEKATDMRLSSRDVDMEEMCVDMEFSLNVR